MSPANPAQAQTPALAPQSLAQLAQLVGQPAEQLRVAIFRRVPDESLVEHGTRVDSQLILDDVPGFASSCLGALKRMTAEQRALIKLPPGLFALLVDEAALLARLKVDHDAMIAAGAGATPEGREAHVRREMREGIALRNVSYQALRNVLGREGMRDVDAVVGTADTPARLADGLDGLADVIRKLQGGDALDRLLAGEFGLDEAFADSLHERAVSARALADLPPPPDRIVTQRMLDLQDGRVLHLMAIVVRAFRVAHKADAAVGLPELRATAPLFDTRPHRSDPATPTPPAVRLASAPPERAAGCLFSHGEQHGRDDPRRIAHDVEVRGAVGRVEHLHGHLDDGEATQRGAKHDLALEGEARAARPEREGCFHRVTPEAALGVLELPAGEERQPEVGDAVAALVGAGGAGAREIAHAEHQGAAVCDLAIEPGRLVGRVLPVGIDRDDGVEAVLARPAQGRPERLALAPVGGVAADDGPRLPGGLGRPVAGAVVEHADLVERGAGLLDDRGDGAGSVEGRDDGDSARGAHGGGA
jgi:hypothetical protein